MQKKQKTAFVCGSCGQEYSKWMGRCTNCGEWQSITEFRIPGSGRTASRASQMPASGPATPVPLSECQAESVRRRPTGFAEIDRVLGGGLVTGAAALVGGDPGIGKSTLMLQLAANVVDDETTVAYVSAEESLEQLSLRGTRLGLAQRPVHLLAETRVDEILAAIEQLKPSMLVVDSIQTVFSSDFESAPGSVSQVRECAARFLRFAKERGCVVFLVGHVTKEGALAGPRVLEHMVDTVLYFEGDSSYQYRLLRAVKNRFGPSGEIALLSMNDRGLRQITNASEFFLMNRDEPQAGTAVVPVLEGSRILAVEFQALVNRSHFGMPQRVASGINPKKLSLLLAVLERYGGIMLGDHDVFFNVAGGLSISEPAGDLGIAGAVLSSFRNTPLRSGQALLGEIGLGGEIRQVNNMSGRLKELAATGFTECIVPEPKRGADWAGPKAGITLIPCKHIQRVQEHLFG
jgi:DNA repair protein RadA/Sms